MYYVEDILEEDSLLGELLRAEIMKRIGNDESNAFN